MAPPVNLHQMYKPALLVMEPHTSFERSTQYQMSRVRPLGGAVDRYAQLRLTSEAPCEAEILRDINRTFPNHVRQCIGLHITFGGVLRQLPRYPHNIGKS